MTTVTERVSKLVDPDYHFQVLAEDLRKKLKEVNEAYSECLKYGLAGDFYIGPNKVYVNLPDTVTLKRTQVTRY